MSTWKTEQVLISRVLHNADVIFESTEGHKFLAHKCKVFQACQGFDNCVDGVPAKLKRLDHIKTKFSTLALYLFIWYAYPPKVRARQQSPPIESRDDIKALTKIACDFEVKPGTLDVRNALLARSFQANDSNWAYLVAYHYRLRDVCEATAFDSLRFYFATDFESSEDELRGVDGLSVVLLHRYRQQCKASILERLLPKDITRYNCDFTSHPELGPCQCGVFEMGAIIRPYWNSYTDSVLQALMDRPHMDIVYDQILVDAANQTASVCASCMAHAATFFVQNVMRLRQDIEFFIRRVPLLLPFDARNYEEEIDRHSKRQVFGWSPLLDPMKEIEIE